jgi:hypothetical protein
MPQTPRAGSETVADVPWLARMIDKARLEAAGEIAEFDLDYPCPMDQRLLAQLNIDGKTFQQICVSAQNDDQIVAALLGKGALPIAAAV